MNQEGYPDPTAERAVEKLMKISKGTKVKDRTAAIGYLMLLYRNAADSLGFEITNRIVFKDKQTGKEYK